MSDTEKKPTPRLVAEDNKTGGFSVRTESGEHVASWLNRHYAELFASAPAMYDLLAAWEAWEAEFGARGAKSKMFTQCEALAAETAAILKPLRADQ